MKLLLAAASFDPATGGPAQSVPALAASLARRGATVGLWAADGTVATAPGVTALRGGIAEAVARFAPDLLHDNGIWLPHNHRIAAIARRRGIARMVSMRGMLEPWAIRHRALKKKLAWTLYQRRDLESAGLLHATAPAEQASARALGLGGPCCVIANGVAPATPGTRPRRAPGGLRTALFLSRIHPKKGLPMLLRAWARERPQGWQLLIAGPDEDGHAAEIAAEIAALGLAGAARLTGPVYGAEKEALLRGADLFVLPTHSENFGMAVAEALAYEVPVLTTRGAPWESLVEHSCGWWVEPEEQAIGEALRTATGASDAARRAMGRRGAVMVADRFDWGSIAMQFLAEYEALLARR
ncbi:MAG: glycosyltransferase [Sphingomonas sp.]